jgi:hypothetical protein
MCYTIAHAYGLTKEPLVMGRLSTVDIPILTSLDQLIFIEDITYLFTEKAILTRRSPVLALSLQLVFPGQT